MQHKTFKKLLNDDYEFVVFNDASDAAIAHQIQAMCDWYGIRCIRVPQEIHDRPYLPRLPDEPYHRPNIRHVNCCQYSLDVLGFDFDGIVGFIDSDIFLIRPLSITHAMENYDVMTVGRCSSSNDIVIGYWWPGLCFMRMNKLPDKRTVNFNCGKINGLSVDSGGYSYYYQRTHPEVRCRGIGEIWGYELFCPDRYAPSNPDVPNQEKIIKYKQLGFNEKEITFLLKKPDTIQFLFDNNFLHYRAGTNYDNQSKKYIDGKMALISAFLDDVIGE